MTQKEFDNILKKQSFLFDIKDTMFIGKVESILLKNGYKWRSCSIGEPLRHFSRHSSVILYINFNGDEPKILSYSNTILRQMSIITITDETYSFLCNFFKPIPNYKPRKIVREL